MHLRITHTITIATIIVANVITTKMIATTTRVVGSVIAVGVLPLREKVVVVVVGSAVVGVAVGK